MSSTWRFRFSTHCVLNLDTHTREQLNNPGFKPVEFDGFRKSDSNSTEFEAKDK